MPHLESDSEKIARYKKEVDDFAYIISHDISSPLRAVFGSVSILESKLKDKISDEDKVLFEYINNGQKRFSEMMQEINSYGKLSITHSPSDSIIDLKDIIEKAKVALEKKIISQNAEVEISGLLPEVNGDYEQLYFIFWELLGNALKYSSTERNLKVKISSESLEDSYIISVEDNGIGINEEYFDKIFQIFRKLHHEEDYPGHGTGLASAKKIADIHGGDLMVESDGQSWTKFKLQLPK